MPIDIADVAEVIYYTEDSSSPLTIVKPAAFAPGELLVFIIAHDALGGGLSSLTAGPGWVDKGNYNDTVGDSAGRVWTHPYDPADPGTWDFGYGSTASVAGALIRITGADLTPVVTLTSSAGAQVSGTATSPSVTPTGINDLLITALCPVCNGNAFTETDPAGMTNRGQVQVADLYMAIAVASQQLTDGSSTGSKTWSSVSPSTSAGGTLSIAVKSSGFLDPDPPPNPPPPLVPPWLLRELVGRSQLPVQGGQGTPTIKEKLFGGASGANVSLVTSATTAVDDLLVVFHGNNFYTAAQLLTPTGTAGTWSQDAVGDNGSNSAHMKLWTRKVTVAGAQTVTLAPAVDEGHTVHLFVIAGEDTTTWIDAAAGGNGASSTSHITPTVDPGTPTALLLVAAQSTSVGNYTIPTTLGMAKLGEVDVGSFCTSASGAEVLGSDNPTGTRTFTITAAGAYATASVAIKAPSAPPAGTFTNAPAENVTATVAANDATASVQPPAEGVSATGTANDASVVTGTETNAPAENATATGTANDATVQIQVFAEAVSATGAANDASALVQAAAEGITSTGASQDASVSITAPAEAVAATGVANDAPGLVQAFPPAVAATGTANDATFTDAPAEGVTATGQANDAAPALSVSAENVTATGAANSPIPAIQAAAEAVTATGTANDAAALTGAIAVADIATVTAVVFDGAVAESTFAENTTATGTANDSAPKLDLASGSAAGMGAAMDATTLITVAVIPATATASAVAFDLALLATVGAGSAFATVDAIDAAVPPPITRGSASAATRSGPTATPTTRPTSAVHPVQRDQATMRGGDDG